MAALLLIASAVGLLAGCSTIGSVDPVSWWHKQEGGKIAEQRPAPPGADQAYPNLVTVPAKPTAPDPAALKTLTDSLIADRTNAQHAAQAAPIADPSSPSASPGLFGVGSAPPPPAAGMRTANASGTNASGTNPAGANAGGPPAASASMPAVTAPPAPSTPPPPAPAPRKAVQSVPLEAPPQAAAPAASAGQSIAPSQATGTGPVAVAPSVPPGPPAAVATAQPLLPAGPPARPAVAGAPPPALPAPSPMPEAGAKSAAVVFVQDATSLSPVATDEVKAFAAQRGNAVIGVTGYGDATASDPGAQSSALNLGLARAQSIVEALKSAGVPGNAIRVSAEASGRGASLHLLQ